METMKTRNHVSYILEQLGKTLIFLVILILGQAEVLEEAVVLFRDGKWMEAFIAMGAIFVVIIVVVGLSAWRWYRTTITVADGMVTIEQNTLNKKKDSIAVKNISNINLEQNLFEMLVGTYMLKLDTDTMSTADKTDVKIVLKKDDAYAMKNVIMSMIKEEQEEHEEMQEAAIPEADFMEDENEKNYDVTYSFKEIIKNCLINTSIAGALVAIGMLIGTVASVVLLVKEGETIGGVLLGCIMQLFVGGSVAWAIVKGWLADYNFRAKRQGDKIYVRCGLLKVRKYAVPVNRINAVCIQTTLIGRLCRYAYVKVINVGGEGDDVDGMKLMLFEPLASLREHLRVLLPEMDMPEYTLEHQTMGVLIKKLAKWLVILGIVCGVAIRFLIFQVDGLWLIWVCVLVTVFVLLSVCLRWRSEGIAVLDDYLVIRRGVFSQTTEWIPYDRIQFINYTDGPLERRMNMRHGYVSILASTQSRMQPFGCFSDATFGKLEEKFQKTYKKNLDNKIYP